MIRMEYLYKLVFMKPEKLSKIGKTIKEVRKAQKLSLREVAKKSGVTAGLLSKIENFRTIPSLPVLNSVAEALEVSLVELVKPLSENESFDYVLIRKDEGVEEEREDSKGLNYFSLFTQNLGNVNFKVNIVEVESKANRAPVSTNAMELVHVLEGSFQYGFETETVSLEQGDTFYFDGNAPHSVENLLKKPARMLKVYFFDAN